MTATALHILRETAYRTWLKTLRRPVPLTFSFVQPLLWMMLFGFLFQRFALGPAFAGFSYLDFLVPGVCVMTVLFGASQSGVMLVRDLQTHFLPRMARATAHPRWMLMGKITADVLRLLFQAVVVALLGVALGARLAPDLAAVVVSTAGLALFAVAYASLSCWIALKSEAQESMAVFIHLINLPLLFTSTALVPARQMPAWLEGIAGWNPLTLAADGLRGAFYFHRAPDLWTTILPLAVLGALLFAAAGAAMAKAADE